MRRISGWAAFASMAIAAACTGGSDSTSSSSSSSGSTSSTSSTSSSGASTSSSGDGQACVTVDEATYDKGCTGDENCVVLPMGTLCTGNCGCGGVPVNHAGRTRWDTETSSIKLAACPCAAPDTPRCVQGKCILCAFVDAAPGCPDGG